MARAQHATEGGTSTNFQSDREHHPALYRCQHSILAGLANRAIPNTPRESGRIYAVPRSHAFRHRFRRPICGRYKRSPQYKLRSGAADGICKPDADEEPKVAAEDENQDQAGGIAGLF